MKWHRRQKWIMLAALTIGTTFQLTACRDEAALFGLRTVFSAFTYPIDLLIQQLILLTA